MEGGSDTFLINVVNRNDERDAQYQTKYLIEQGWAEEIKDDIDIEEIRNYFRSLLKSFVSNTPFGVDIACSNEQGEFFTAYRIIKAVIEKLNGDWKDSFEELKFFPEYSTVSEEWFDQDCNPIAKGLLPFCKSENVAKQLISLCEPELKVLFGVE